MCRWAATGWIVRVYIAGIEKEKQLNINKNKEMDGAEFKRRFQDKDCVK